MKFSIRELLLVTVIATVLAAWWVDRSRLASENKMLNDWADEREDEWLEKFAEHRREISTLRSRLPPDSSAPAPNPSEK